MGPLCSHTVLQCCLIFLTKTETLRTAAVNEYITTLHGQPGQYENANISADAVDNSMYMPKQPDNVDIVRHPVHLGYV